MKTLVAAAEPPDPARKELLQKIAEAFRRALSLSQRH